MLPLYMLPIPDRSRMRHVHAIWPGAMVSIQGNILVIWCTPWVWVILRKLFLMSGYDVSVLIEYDEAYGPVSERVSDVVLCLCPEWPYVVPQSSDPTYSPCFNPVIDMR